MIYLLIAIVAFLLGLLPTRYYYAKKIALLKEESKNQDDKTFHYAFKSGWEDGQREGLRKAHLESITKNKNL